MEKIFFDTNILLDILMDREGAYNAMRIVELSRNCESIHIYLSYLSIANSAFVLRKRSLPEIKAAVSSILKTFCVLPSGDHQIIRALKCGTPDFEDALQIASAEEKGCDLIITRNPVHFRDYTEIPVLSPEEFLYQCGAK